MKSHYYGENMCKNYVKDALKEGQSTKEILKWLASELDRERSLNGNAGSVNW